MRSLVFLTLSVFVFTALPTVAESGDAEAVIQYCGTPTSEHQGVSQVTNKMERDLTYGRLILHFEPAENGWTFLSGWDKHLPVTQTMLEGRLPCFRQAMEASRAERPSGSPTNEDPAIREQSATAQADTSSFGIPHLWLILGLALLVLLFFFFPDRRTRQSKTASIEKTRYRRKPRLPGKG